MVDCLLEYCRLERDRKKENSMALLLGDHRGVDPLHIEDFTCFWLLRDGTG